MKTGRAEVGLLGSATAPNTSGLHVLAVEDQPLVLISPAPEAGDPGEVVARGDLAGLRLIVSEQGSPMRQLVDDVLASGIGARIVVEVEHRTSILPMVLGGIGHAVTDHSEAHAERRAKSRTTAEAERPPAAAAAAVPIGRAYRPDRQRVGPRGAYGAVHSNNTTDSSPRRLGDRPAILAIKPRDQALDQPAACRNGSCRVNRGAIRSITSLNAFPPPFEVYAVCRGHCCGAWFHTSNGTRDVRRFRPNVLIDLEGDGWVQDSRVGAGSRSEQSH